MLDVFGSEGFLAAITILTSTGLGVFVRTATRNDKHKGYEFSDFSVSLEIIIALTGILASQSIEYFAKKNHVNVYELTVCMYGLLALMLVLWFTSTIIRKAGWKNENELHSLWGVILPNLLGFIILWYFFDLFNFLYT